MIRWHHIALVALLCAAMLSLSACAAEKKGNSDALLAVLVARAIGLKALGSGATCPDGGTDCPAATEGGRTVFGGSFVEGAGAQEEKAGLRISSYSCSDCELALFYVGTVPQDSGAEPLAVAIVGSGNGPLVLPLNALPEEVSVWTRQVGTEWKPDAQAHVSLPNPAAALQL